MDVLDEKERITIVNCDDDEYLRLKIKGGAAWFRLVPVHYDKKLEAEFKKAKKG